MEDKKFSYLVEAYKSALSYVDSFSNRMYARFNILLSMNVALAGVFGTFFVNSQLVTINSRSIIPVIGFFISVFLYMQSAQDKYILNRNINRVNEIRVSIENMLNLKQSSALFSPIDETDSGTKNFIFQNITSWRSNPFSLTKLPAIISILFIIFWCVMFFLN